MKRKRRSTIHPCLPKHILKHIYDALLNFVHIITKHSLLNLYGPQLYHEGSIGPQRVDVCIPVAVLKVALHFVDVDQDLHHQRILPKPGSINKNGKNFMPV